MKKILVISNTYSQLITAIQMKLTLFKNTKVSIVISDQSNNAWIISERLRNNGIFDEVFYIETKKMCAVKDSNSEKTKDILRVIFGTSLYKAFKGKAYDELVYYNPDLFTNIIFATLYHSNFKIATSRYEEGILSYKTIFERYTKVKIAYFIRRILKKKNLEDETRCFYCFTPEQYDGIIPAKKIPVILDDNFNIKNILGELFQTQNIQYMYGEYKYIYFSSVFDFEGGEAIGELELVEKIAESVGKNNLLVKVHPRDKVARFKNRGIHVDNNSSIPWEAVQLNGDFSNTVFLTALSGSVFSVNLILDKPSKTYIMYRMCSTDKNSLAKKQIKNIHSIKNMKSGLCSFEWLVIADSMTDIKQK